MYQKSAEYSDRAALPLLSQHKACKLVHMHHVLAFVGRGVHVFEFHEDVAQARGQIVAGEGRMISRDLEQALSLRHLNAFCHAANAILARFCSPMSALLSDFQLHRSPSVCPLFIRAGGG